jgi:signal transduction histidine kinase
MEQKHPHRLVLRLLFLFSLFVLIPMAITSVTLSLLWQQALKNSTDLGRKHIAGVSRQSLRQMQEELERLEQQINAANLQKLTSVSKEQIGKSRSILDHTAHDFTQRGQRLIQQSYQKQANAFQKMARAKGSPAQDPPRSSPRKAPRQETAKQSPYAADEAKQEPSNVDKEVVEQHALKVHEERTQKLALQVHQFLGEIISFLRGIAAAAQPLESERVQAILQRAKERRPHMQAIAVLNKDGREIAKYPPDPNADPNETFPDRSKGFDYLVAAQGKEYISTIVGSSSKLYVRMAVPISVDDGKPCVGVVTANVALDPLDDILRRSVSGKGTYAFVANHSQDIIAHSQPQTNLTRISLENVPVVLSALNDKDSDQPHLRTDCNSEGVEVVRTSVFINHKGFYRGGWVLVSVQPKEEAMTEASNALRQTKERIEANVPQKAAEPKKPPPAKEQKPIHIPIKKENKMERDTALVARQEAHRLTQKTAQEVQREASRLVGDAQRRIQILANQMVQDAEQDTVQQSNTSAQEALSKLRQEALFIVDQAAGAMEQDVLRTSRESARKASKSALMISLLFLIGAMTVAVVTARSVLQPLSRVADGARAIAAGDYSYRLQIDAPDTELALLGAEFNAMATALASTRSKLELDNRRLSEEKRILDAIIARMPEGLIVTDAEGRVLVMNATAYALLDLHDNPMREDRASVMKALPSPAERSQPFAPGEDRTLLSRSGRRIQVSTAPITDEEGKWLGCVRVLHDISEQREISHQQTEFFSLVTHELRVPLTSILGFTSLLLGGGQGDVTQEQSKSLKVVQRQAERLATLINNLLDVSRIEAGHLQLEQEPVPIDEIAEGVMDDLRPQAQEKQIRLHLKVASRPCIAYGDYERLTQVFANLLSNAIKFTPEEGSVTVILTPQSNDVLVEVSDTGIGIPQDELGRVFDKFYQVRRSAERKNSGTGLGLAIVQGIVEAHGGKVWVKSGEGQGTQFFFTIPAVA